MRNYPVANAASITGALLYVICWALTLIAPDLIYNYLSLVSHSLNVEAVRSTRQVGLLDGLIGLVVWTVSVWAVIYLYGLVKGSARRS